MYDLEPSPQKRSSLPAHIAALEPEEKLVSADGAEVIVPESSQLQQDDYAAAVEVPGSEDVAVVSEADHVESLFAASVLPSHDALPLPQKQRGRPRKRKSGESTTSTRLSDVDTAASLADVPSVVAQKDRQTDHREHEHVTATIADSTHNAAATSKHKAAATNKRRKIDDPKTRRSNDAASGQGPSAMAQQDAAPRDDAQPEVRIPIRSTQSRLAQAEAERTTSATTPTSDHMEIPNPQPTRTLSSSKASGSTKQHAARTRATPENKAESGDVENDNSDQGDGQETNESNGNQDYAEDVNAEDTRSATTPMSVQQYHRLSDLEKVCFFRDRVQERPGVCSTKMGRKIHRACDRARVTLSQSGEGPSLTEMTNCVADLTGRLERIESRVERSSWTDFKGDAFRYLFRALAVVFEQLIGHLQTREGEVTESLAAMRILFTFVCHVITFKDAMKSWSVKGLQRGRDEGKLFKDVESYLIVPLRSLEAEYRKRLHALETVERSRQAFLNQQRKEQEEARISETQNIRRERRKRWQDLHIIRMQCEPNPAQRQKLRFVEPVEAAETDANGDRFERVPFFGERSVPPPQWTAAASGREWTGEQEIVLLDALQSSTGKFVIRTTPTSTALT